MPATRTTRPSPNVSAAEADRRFSALLEPGAVAPALTAHLFGVEQEFEFYEGHRQRDFRNFIHAILAKIAPKSASGPYGFRIEDGLLVTCDGSEAEIAIPPMKLYPGRLSQVAPIVSTHTQRLEQIIRDWAGPNAKHYLLRGFSTHFNAYCGMVDIDRLCEVYAQTLSVGMMMLTDLKSSPGLLVRPRPRRFEVGSEFVPPGEGMNAAATYFIGSFLAVWQAVLTGREQDIPVWLDGSRIEYSTQRYGYYADRAAFGDDLYAKGRAARLRTASGQVMSAQSVFEASWAFAKPALLGIAQKRDLDLVEAYVSGLKHLPLEIADEESHIAARPVSESPKRKKRISRTSIFHRENAFSKALDCKTIGPFALTPSIVTWDYAIYKVTRSSKRGAPKTTPFFVNVPRRYLHGFDALIDTAAADLVATLKIYAAQSGANEGRRLESSERAEAPGLFDQIAPEQLEDEGSAGKKKKKGFGGAKTEGCSVTLLKKETETEPPHVKICVPATKDPLVPHADKPQEPPVNATQEGQGVFLHSGAFMHSQGDLAVKAPGFDLAFTRHYRSSISYDGLMGNGWDHIYNQRVVPTKPETAEGRDFGWCEIYTGPEEAPSGDLWFYDGTGRRTFHAFDHWEHRTLRRVTPSKLEEFKAVVTTYKSNPGERFELQRIAVYEGPRSWGTPIYYTLRSYEGSEHIFNCHGHLMAIRDANFNTMRFGYALPFNPDTGYLTLKSITDTAKRSYAVQHDQIAGKVRLEYIADTWNRKISFHYNTRGELERVLAPSTDATDHRRLYRYGTRRGLLTEVIAPNEAKEPSSVATAKSVIENQYTPDERVQQQRVGSPPGVTPQAGGTGTFTYNGEGRVETHTDRRGEVKTYTYKALHDTAVVETVSLKNRPKSAPGFSHPEPDSYVTRFVYDDWFLIKELHHPGGGHEEFVYETRNSPVVVGDERNWVQENYTFQNNLSKGNLLIHRHVSAQPGGGSMQTVKSYEPRYNRAVYVSTPLGVTHSQFDNGWSATPEKNANALVITHPPALRPNAMAIDVVDRFTYGPHGQIAEHVEPSGMKSSFSYHPSGEVETVTIDPDGLALTSKITRDERGNPVEIKNPMNRTTIQKFDLRDNLIKVTDALNHIIETKFDHNDQATDITRSLKDDAAFLPAGPNETRVNTKIEFDILGQTVALIEDANGLNIREETQYDPEGNPVVEKTPRATGTTPEEPAAQIQREYNSRGQLFSETGAPGHADEKVEYFFYDTQGNMSYRISPENGVWSHDHDGFGRLTSWTDPAGNKQEMRRNGAGQVVQINFYGPLSGPTPTDRNGTNNRLLAQTVQTQDAYDRIIQSVAYRFSPAVGPQFGVERIVNATFFDAGGHVEETVDPENGRTKYSYDSAMRLTSVVKPGGHKTDYVYDRNGNVRIETRTDAVEGQPFLQNPGALKVNVRRDYDVLDRMVSETVDGQGTTEFAYDSFDNIRGTRRNNGRPTVTEFDTLGRETKMTQPCQPTLYNTSGTIVTKWAYNANSFTVSATNGLLQETKYTFDPLDRLRKIDDALGGATEAVNMDGSGNPTLLRRRGGQEFRSTYDSLGRVTERTHINPSAGAITQSYEYDGGSNVTKATDQLSGPSPSSSTVTRTYNSLGWLMGERQDGFDVGYFHDNKIGHVSGVEYPSGIGTEMEWNASGRLADLKKDGSDLVRYTYLGQRVLERQAGLTLTDPNATGGARTYQYPLIKRAHYTPTGLLQGVEHLLHNAVSDPSMPTNIIVTRADRASFDASGRLSEQEMHDRKITYRYDDADRMVHEEATNIYDGSGTKRRGTLKEMDAAGNIRKSTTVVESALPGRRPRIITSETDYDASNFPKTRTVRVDGGPPRTTQITNSVSQSLIENDHTVRAGRLPPVRTKRRIFTDALGRVSTVFLETPGANVDNWRITLKYDAFGRRIGHIRETVRGPSNTVILYTETRYTFWDDRCIEEYVRFSDTGQWRLSRRYYHGTDVNEIVALDVQESIAGDLDGDGNTSELSTLIFTDSRDGSPQGLVRQRYNGSQFPFLVERYATDSDGRHQYIALDAQNNPSITPFGVTGHEIRHQGRWFHDLEAIYYNGKRFYDPAFGQFLTPDPSGAWSDPFAFGNAYTFAGRNAVQKIDPNGELAWDLVDLGFVIFGFVAFVRDPSWENFGLFMLDLVAALPGIPAVHRYAQGSAAAVKFFLHARQANRVVSAYQASAQAGTELGKASLDDPNMSLEDRAYHAGMGSIFTVLAFMGVRESGRDAIYYFPIYGTRARVIRDIREAKNMLTRTQRNRLGLPPDTPVVGRKCAVNRRKEMNGELATMRGMELLGYRASGIPMGYRKTKYGWHMNGIDRVFERGGFLRTRYAVAEAKFSEKASRFGLSLSKKSQKGMPDFPSGGAMQGFNTWNINRLWMALLDKNATPETMRLARTLIGLAEQRKLPAYVGYFQSINEKRHGLWRLVGEGAGPGANATRHIPFIRH